MFPIDTADASPTLPAIPAAGTPGYFRDRNPSLGIDGTRVPAWWLNQWDWEAKYILALGGVEADKANFQQLGLAITNIATARVNALAPGIADARVNALAPGIADARINALAPGIADAHIAALVPGIADAHIAADAAALRLTTIDLASQTTWALNATQQQASTIHLWIWNASVADNEELVGLELGYGAGPTWVSAGYAGVLDYTGIGSPDGSQRYVNASRLNLYGERGAAPIFGRYTLEYVAGTTWMVNGSARAAGGVVTGTSGWTCGGSGALPSGSLTAIRVVKSSSGALTGFAGGHCIR